MYMQENLRNILSKNIKKARSALHITQVKLAVYSDISVAHMIEIEQCKTWVSDKTLTNIAKALNMDVFELLVPEKNEETGQKDVTIQQMARLIKAKKAQLRKSADEAMDDLIMEMLKLNKKNEA
jgi:transcriptional regulator with XRE-family HTH domain